MVRVHAAAYPTLPYYERGDVGVPHINKSAGRTTQTNTSSLFTSIFTSMFTSMFRSRIRSRSRSSTNARLWPVAVQPLVLLVFFLLRDSSEKSHNKPLGE